MADRVDAFLHHYIKSEERMAKVSWRKARAVFSKNRSRLLRRKGVIGAGLGVAEDRARSGGDPVIRVYVEKKIPEDRLRSNQRLPGYIDGVRVDVIEGAFAGLGCLQVARSLRIFRNPLFGGVAISRYSGRSFGTLSAVVVDSGGALFGLTAHHVVGNKGSRVVQPRSGGMIGRVDRSVFSHAMDAALVRMTSKRAHAAGVSDGCISNLRPIEGVIASIPEEALPFPVELVGACSGRTFGMLTSVRTSMSIGYGRGKRLVFRDQLLVVADKGVREISRAGDSGSLPR